MGESSVGTFIAATVGRNWSFWLIGATHTSKPTRYRAMVLESRYLTIWAESGSQPDPVSAFARVKTICLTCPPWGREEG